MNTGSAKPQVSEYSNYRKYLRDLYDYQKSQLSRFSYRAFSKLAGFSSPNFLKLVMDGKRNLTHESIAKIARALKLKREETNFFRNLVLLNQAETMVEKKYCAEELMRSRLFRELHPLKSAQSDYYSHWYHVPVRELVATKNFREDPEWIAQRLRPSISPAEAKSALEILLKLDLIRRDANGKLVQTDALLSTGDESSKISVAQFHREMIQKGAEAIDQIPSAERDISALTLGVSSKGLMQIKELVQRFRKELLAIARTESDLTEVVQLNFQLFPLTESGGGAKK